MDSVDAIILPELDNSGVLRPLDDAQVRTLRASGLVKLTPEGRSWRIRPGGKVGAVRAGDLDVQVQPKVGVVRLLFFLGYAKDPRFRPEDVTAAPASGLWPAMAESLIRQAERALAGGLLQGYTSFEEALPLIRGRVRFAEQFARRPAIPLPIEVQFDDWTVDIVENRLLRTAVRRMLAVPRLLPSARERLERLDARLAGVPVLPPHAPVPLWSPSRINMRYVPALRLAELILDNQSAEPDAGGIAIAAFAVNMATVFENFVAAAIREALGSCPGVVEEQYRTYLDAEKTIPIRPDLVYLVDGRPVAVFDAKYKLEHPTSGFPNGDTYQMLAYCAALDVRTGWLVYAKGTTPPERKHIRNTTIEIIHHPLDLLRQPHEILDDVAALVRRAAAPSAY
ncbi:restriction endonuclease [Micromonospora sp. NPDC049049]|uniref:McrC family protein n=1 Tax=Micromonospora sp. NPDC049049 TaxID=3155495 RepID=UPI0033DD315F